MLVLQGKPIPYEQQFELKELLERAIENDEWPLMLIFDGPVYWVEIGPPATVEPRDPRKPSGASIWPNWLKRWFGR